MLGFALLTLTLTVDGDLRMTLSDMESPAACEIAKAQVSEILTDAGVSIHTALCGETALRLTPYEHRADPEDEMFLYRVQTDRQRGFVVTHLSPNADCQADADAFPPIYCARSSQAVVTDR